MPVNDFNAAAPRVHDISDWIDGQLQGNVGTSIQFPEDRPKYYCTLDFERYRFRTGTGFTAGDRVGTGQMILPLPVTLVDKHVVKYDEKPIGGTLLASLAQQAGGALLEPIMVFYGLTPNWYQTIMFDRPEYKRHELQFKLAPRNFNEATTIRNIITSFNNYMAPDTQGAANLSLLFNFPDIVKIILRPNSKFLYKFKPAVIEQMVVNYNGGGQKAFYHNPAGGAANDGDNPPESVEITLHVIEVEYWLRRHFTNENDQ